MSYDYMNDKNKLKKKKWKKLFPRIKAELQDILDMTNFEA